ncbi:glycoside hydrolase family 28 protein [Dothidotthia symphoricarpi CBS 119687]|uniref:Glycoside hydrolase family 28 protein n=1 Tax=Dothidotthia symphoricarpi CBS 119687 TaxID=1392245 RepID=A0A6A6A0Y9_9PLEO|nr:glycoside hydrolase family 28 protein [Dothidotthia symphoricarpi CBS 119687]KAF2125519.1 glycoside hydrolase family 28 protein [Dothidotthia symphoricarpi CBS 119687]
MHISQLLLAATALVPAAFAQLSGTVGPLTTHAVKTAKKTCNVLDYGAKADKSTDIGPPLLKAFTACKTGGTVVVPTGDYAMATWVTFESGKAWALQLDGTIYRTGSDSGNMLFIRNANDFELFSSTGKGAVQGNGYQDHVNGKRTGARLLRVEQSTNFSVHDIVLVDAPMFHFVIAKGTNGEAYNMVIRGGDWGGLDGVDVSGTNIWIHDIAVTNKDECVTVKSPSTNLLIENIHCNISGGCGMGSLPVDTAISTVTYRNIYTWKSNQMMMIKSNGGSGYVEDVVFENFSGHGNAYSIDIDQYWTSMSALSGSGVALSNLTFNGWTGTMANGAERGPVKVVCADGAPCTDVTLSNINMWTETGSKMVSQCRSGYGKGFCLKSSGTTSYAATTITQTAIPTGYSAASMKENLVTAWGTASSIPIPTLQASYYPGKAPVSKLAA